MNTKLIIVPAAALAAFIAIAVVNTASAQVYPGTIPDTNNTISVTGMATQEVKPDRVTVTFAVETMNKTAGGALRANSEAMNKVLGALADAGVKENETRTSFFSIAPTYNYSQTGNVQKLTGYTVTNSILVESSNLTNVSDWVDAAVRAGANRVDSLSFTVSEEKMDELRADLMQKATDNAGNKANALAQALNLTITGVKAASLNDFSNPVPLPLGAATAESIKTPITPGEQTVTSTVTVIYKIG
jgi:uncharacterized protein